MQLIINSTNETMLTVYCSRNYCATFASITAPTRFCIYTLELLVFHVTTVQNFYIYIVLFKYRVIQKTVGVLTTCHTQYT